MVNRHQAESIRAVARPVVARTESDTANLVLLFVIPAKGITTGLRRFGIEPALGKNAPDRLNAGIGSTCTYIRHYPHLKSGLPKRAFVADPINLVVRRSVMGKYAQCLVIFF
ncbi:hypothetical protein FHW69_001607 [Luteibacter sp. Sphag1AF]|nr:hypothetical protein [Luteibacter sp. Sphag1AF]